MSKATILHADLDAFYASVEQRDEPRLRGRPVIVGGGVVLAASYEAKAHGVRTAMGGRQARRLCPQAIVVPPRMSAYSEASKAVFRVFDDTSPLVEGLSIDEAFLDVRGMERIAGTPTEIAVRLRREVLERVGLPITVGVARTKFLAKVASAVAKPNGLLVVPPDGELSFLHPLPVERIWGVGPVTARKLHERGITVVGEVAELAESLARPVARTGGGPQAARARPQPRSAAGARRTPPRLDRVAARARPVAEDRTTSSTPSLVAPRRPRHAPDAGRRPGRTHGRAPPALRRLLARDAIAHPAPRDVTHPDGARHGESAAGDGDADDRAAGPDAVGVAVANLDNDDAVQLTLPLDRHSGSALDAALDEIRVRFGTGAITRAVLLGRDQGLTVPMLPD